MWCGGLVFLKCGLCAHWWITSDGIKTSLINYLYEHENYTNTGSLASLKKMRKLVLSRHSHLRSDQSNSSPEISPLLLARNFPFFHLPSSFHRVVSSRFLARMRPGRWRNIEKEKGRGKWSWCLAKKGGKKWGFGGRVEAICGRSNSNSHLVAGSSYY